MDFTVLKEANRSNLEPGTLWVIDLMVSLGLITTYNNDFVVNLWKISSSKTHSGLVLSLYF